jgi:DNA-binding NtrC family response regulator
VDDEETIHRALHRTLRRGPYEFLDAYDAAEANALLEAHPEVAVVICDHFMPGMLGLDVLGEIRRRRPEVCTILLTAQADLTLAITALNQRHVHRLFTKPWNAEELRASLHELLYGDDGSSCEPAAGGEGSLQRLERELVGERDETTGAFVIGPPDEDAGR